MAVERLAQIGPYPVVQMTPPAASFDTSLNPKNLIVAHCIEGTAESGISTVMASGSVVSYHIIIDYLRKRYIQFVPLSQTANAVGNYPQNQRSISWSIPGFVTSPFAPEAVYMAAILTGYLSRERGIPLRRIGLVDVGANVSGICGHMDIPDPANPKVGGGKDHHTDPGGGFPWAVFLKSAYDAGGIPVTLAPAPYPLPSTVGVASGALGQMFRAFFSFIGGLLRLLGLYGRG